MVSIPFKRERLSELSDYRVANAATEFQFPSNGKGFPNRKFQRSCKTDLGFNSLQTGKAFRTIFYIFRIGFFEENVSIPFKRERLSELKDLTWRRVRVGTLVSIPFKRERLSEQKISRSSALRCAWFQFPSNGKGFPNEFLNWRMAVAISFNSLQTGKAFRTSKLLWFGKNKFFSFNSLQTGKAFRTILGLIWSGYWL